jgi:hypothetical protein
VLWQCRELSEPEKSHDTCLQRYQAAVESSPDGLLGNDTLMPLSELWQIPRCVVTQIPLTETPMSVQTFHPAELQAPRLSVVSVSPFGGLYGICKI